MRFVPWLVLVTACGTDYERPPSVEYITEAILVPSCAAAQCHSAFAQREYYSFATVAHARISLFDLNKQALIAPDAGVPKKSELMAVLLATVNRMPYDQPLPNADIELIRHWIEIGVPGAQCDPAQSATGCAGDKVYTCNEHYNLQDFVEDCSLLAPSSDEDVWVCSAGACVEVAKDQVVP